MKKMAMVNVNNLLNMKDSRWLQLEVCREFQRNKCSRPDTECKFAHPPANVEVQNGRVTACYDSIKGRCNREKPPCKYFHPPPHLKDQLLINGRNHLALKNALMQQIGLAPGQPVVPGQVPGVQATNPYLPGVSNQGYNPYFATAPLVPLVDQGGPGVPLGVPQQTVVQPKVPKVNGYHGMVGFKRPAGDKSGVVYQPANNPSAAYQQLMQLQQPPFVPVSCATGGASSAGHNHGGSNAPNSVSNGDAHGNDASKMQVKHDPNDDGDDGGVGEDDKNEPTAVKRMRVNVGGGGPGGGQANNNTSNNNNNSSNNNNSGGNVTSSNAAAAAALTQSNNNAAYMAAAQNYHNALAAINYTGVALQTNKNPQQTPAPVPAVGSGMPPTGGGVGGGTNANSGGFNPAAGGLTPQQQQQLLTQYQAMAAAFANPAAFQLQQATAAAAAAGGGVGQGQQSGVGLNMNMNVNMNAAQAAAAAGLNPLAAAASVNPLLAATLPQFAAAQRLNTPNVSNAGSVSVASLNAAGLGAAGGLQTAGGVVVGAQNPGGQNNALNPFGVPALGSTGSAGGAATPGLQYAQSQQQALLAAYGQFARAPVPGVPGASGAHSMASAQQLLVGNPAAAAAAVAAANPGVKRMRPN